MGLLDGKTAIVTGAARGIAKYAISYLLNCQNEKLPKETVFSFEE